MHTLAGLVATFPFCSQLILEMFLPANECVLKSFHGFRYLAMTFVNEAISPSDMQKYGLDEGPYTYHNWTRDAERNYYLLGEVSGNTAYGDEYLGRFDLFVDGQLYNVILRPGFISRSFDDTPFIVSWDELQLIYPKPATEDADIIAILKEALTVYGYRGRLKQNIDKLRVHFSF
jgi:hypothetical protein